MAFINIAEWTAVNTTQWLRGLDDSILPYVQFFLNNNINGCRLLLLSCDDLNNLNVCKVGHQELILEGVDLLKHLHYNFGSETLQSLALRLGCRARSLFNQLKQNQLVINCEDNTSNSVDHNHNSNERVSTQTLSAVTDILSAVKTFISWIDRYPFEGQYIPVRKTIMKLSIELASTAQRDQFVEKPNEIIKHSSTTLAELCDRIVQELNDSLAIQPAVLDIVTVKKKPDEELGMHIHSSYSGIHIVGGIKFQSPSHRCGRIEEGDEIIQVSYQTVVGWQLKKLVNSMKEHPTEIVLTIKKRPRHSNLMGQVIVLKPYKIPNRKSGRQNGNRVKNAATTTVGSDGDDDAFLPNDDKSDSKSFYKLYPTKPKLPVRRRATVSGSSPIVEQPSFRIEDIVQSMKKKDAFIRSISHESPTNQRRLVLSPNRELSVLSVPSMPSMPSKPSKPSIPSVPIVDKYPSVDNCRPIEAPRPLPRKSITRRENVSPAFVSKMDKFEQMIKPLESGKPPIPNTPPVPPRLMKNLNGLPKTKNSLEQNDDLYEYVFRPTMAMIKTGIVNPLYDRVPNNTWSGERGSKSTGKSRMPLPNEMRQQSTQKIVKQELKPIENVPVQPKNELSILDQEYNRLYGNKKANERLSPNPVIPPYVSKSASSAQIKNIYTSNLCKTSSSSIGYFDDLSPKLTHFGSRPHTPSSSDNSMSSSSGISSYYSYSKIPAKQMQRIENNKPETGFRETSASLYNSRKGSPQSSAECLHHINKVFDFNKSMVEKETRSEPQKSSFRLFSSPKLFRKFSTPKYQKERNLEKREFTNKLTPFEDNSKQTTTPTKTGRLFFGSPKLTRALEKFGGSAKKSPPQLPSIPPPPNRANQENITFSDPIPMIRSSSDSSSVESIDTGVKHNSHHIIEKKLTKNELTIQLPLLTKSCPHSSELPATPETPRKPAMGISMIGKKRRPSNVSTDSADIHCALNQYHLQRSGSSNYSRSPYTTEDTDDEWVSIVRTLESANRTLDSEFQDKEPHN